MKPGLWIYSVLPSPYQRDLFEAAHRLWEGRLRVFYTAPEARDSPWKKTALHPWETILPGLTFSPLPHLNFKWNREVPLPPSDAEIVVNLDLPSPTTQALFRKLPEREWWFWGEKLRAQSNPVRRAARHLLTRPLRHARGILAIGRNAAADYKARFPGLSVHELPYACDLEPFLALPRNEAGTEPVFLYAGQMIRRKGIDVLLDAFASLVNKGFRPRLRLSGREGELPGLLAPLAPAVRERIDYAGFIQPDALPAVFGSAGIFILPSRYDGWGVVINQALGAGMPVIASDAAGASELVQPGENGATVPAGDAAALAAAMRRYLEAPDLIARHGAASRVLAAAHTPAARAQRLKEILSAP